MLRRLLLPVLAGAALSLPRPARPQVPAAWQSEWPRTEFSRHIVPLAEIRSGGLPRDGIPPIDDPLFVPAGEAAGLDGQEPVLGLVIAGDARAYPLRVLIWHEIVNDIVGGVPVAVTYCPLCNTAIVFDRRLGGRTLGFGTTGKLRHSDLVMYDRQTESWWQQYGGTAIVGTLAGARLREVPARLESLDTFRARAPQGRLLVPRDPSRRRYGINPYAGYDAAPRPFLFGGEPPPAGIEPMMRVVAVGNRAWALPLLRARGTIEADGLTITWQPGQRTALGATDITRGAEVGNVVVRRGAEDVAHAVPFAFAFFAFHPDGVLHTEEGAIRR
ncbi:MAG TPA: DUF3179 domain-containing protein [Falsiroseomonas sp.]|jgi:hypothetical protein|nr:DUF3179 domain-containing protein [Falsiroseomonas sp.]